MARNQPRKQVDAPGQSDCGQQASPPPRCDCPGDVVFKSTPRSQGRVWIILLSSNEGVLDECRCSGTEDSS
jgi:hypothetical protein